MKDINEALTQAKTLEKFKKGESFKSAKSNQVKGKRDKNQNPLQSKDNKKLTSSKDEKKSKRKTSS